MKKFVSILVVMLIFMTTIFGLTGCKPPSTTISTPNSTPSSTQKDPDVPVTQTLASTMYFTVIKAEDHSVAKQFEAELNVTAVENAVDGDSFDLTFNLSDDLWYDFTDSKNHFKMQHEELGLPYYCAKGFIFQPILDGYAPFDFAVDFEKEYMVFKESSNVMTSYTVASSDPDIDPMEIVEHFSKFFHIYDYSSLFNENVTDFYYDLHGTWISEDGKVLEETEFYITGTLPDAYEDGETVEMELNFIWPASSGYRNEGYMTYTGSVNVFEEHYNHPNFHGSGILRNSQTDEQISFTYNIFPYDAIVVIYVNGQYLVGHLTYTSQADARLNYYKDKDYIFTTR